MSYWEDRYIEYLGEQDGQIGADGWRDDFNPRASLEKHLLFETVLEDENMTFQYDEVLCPDCGGKMKSRTGAYGVFWGCLSYPECKGTRDSQGRSREDRQKWKNEQSEKTDEMTAKERSKKEWVVPE